jgi:glutaconate CoA-transferase subunit A
LAELVSLRDGVAAVVNDGDSVALEGFTHLIPFAAVGEDELAGGARTSS